MGNATRHIDILGEHKLDAAHQDIPAGGSVCAGMVKAFIPRWCSIPFLSTSVRITAMATVCRADILDRHIQLDNPAQ